ncbi:MAG: ankyrin repeat domain-containing protein, partial [Alphaproteobacteria bacterium]|nr:ankyrin repeat domain-containing protein [Alphaproteobacteria bacterium]
MKFIRFIVLSLLLAPFGAFAAPSDFTGAAQLLAAAKNADIQQVQVLVNNGANINYVDSTGLSLVCTALMNNDLRAAQILQMYGADASQCARLINRYRTQNSPGTTGGLFGGLSTAQGLTLAAAGAAVFVV